MTTLYLTSNSSLRYDENYEDLETLIISDVTRSYLDILRKSNPKNLDIIAWRFHNEHMNIFANKTSIRSMYLNINTPITLPPFLKSLTTDYITNSLCDYIRHSKSLRLLCISSTITDNLLNALSDNNSIEKFSSYHLSNINLILEKNYTILAFNLIGQGYIYCKRNIKLLTIRRNIMARQIQQAWSYSKFRKAIILE